MSESESARKKAGSDKDIISAEKNKGIEDLEDNRQSENSWVDELFETRDRMRAERIAFSEINQPQCSDSENTPKHDTMDRETGSRDDSSHAHEEFLVNKPPSTVALWLHRMKQEYALIRENPSSLLDLLPFIAFLLFLLVSLVLAIYGYSMNQRIAALEKTIAELSATRLSGEMPETLPPVITEYSEQASVDPQWLADQIEMHTRGIRHQLNDVAMQLDAMTTDMHDLAAKQKRIQATATSAVPAAAPVATPAVTRTPKPATSTPVVTEQKAPLLLKPAINSENAKAPDWNVNLVSLSSKDAIEGLRSQYQRQGIPVQLQTADVNGKTIYRLRVTGFDDRAAAEAYAGKIKTRLGLSNIWISQ